jgi:saccharopine dehydrogenase-like NADP-dependent oxidoreductase
MRTGIVGKKFSNHQTRRFWMTFRQDTDSLAFNQNIAWLESTKWNTTCKNCSDSVFKSRLPIPGDLGENYIRKDFIGCRIKGIKTVKKKTYYVYNIASRSSIQRTGTQG